MVSNPLFFYTSNYYHMANAPRNSVNRWISSKKSINKKDVINEVGKKNVVNALGGISKQDKDLLSYLASKWLWKKEIEHILLLDATKPKTPTTHKVHNKSTLKVGIVSDTHMGSKRSEVELLNRAYEQFQKRWIDVAVHAWDILDGSGVYKWQEYELKHHGLQEQVWAVVEDYPTIPWVKTHYILGNHDEAWLKKAWADVGEMISAKRPDMINHWFYNAKFALNNIDFQLHHGGGSASYAKSYRIQKYLENDATPGDVYVLWHYHDALYLLYRNTHCYLPGAFQWETLLAKRFKLGNSIGCWYTEINKDSWIVSVKNEFIKLR